MRERRLVSSVVAAGSLLATACGSGGGEEWFDSEARAEVNGITADAKLTETPLFPGERYDAEVNLASKAPISDCVVIRITGVNIVSGEGENSRDEALEPLPSYTMELGPVCAGKINGAKLEDSIDTMYMANTLDNMPSTPNTPSKFVMEMCIVKPQLNAATQSVGDCQTVYFA